jgi:hypothetical protein
MYEIANTPKPHLRIRMRGQTSPQFHPYPCSSAQVPEARKRARLGAQEGSHVHPESACWPAAWVSAESGECLVREGTDLTIDLGGSPPDHDHTSQMMQNAASGNQFASYAAFNGLPVRVTATPRSASATCITTGLSVNIPDDPSEFAEALSQIQPPKCERRLADYIERTLKKRKGRIVSRNGNTVTLELKGAPKVNVDVRISGCSSAEDVTDAVYMALHAAVLARLAASRTPAMLVSVTHKNAWAQCRAGGKFAQADLDACPSAELARLSRLLGA